MAGARLHDSRLIRALCLGIGGAALGLGLVGIVVPVLPTTPFILLAAACFARSSERFHGMLLGHRIAGPIIQEWQRHRSMSRRVKRFAYGVMLVSFSVSILWIDSIWHRLMLASLGLVLGWFLWRVPVREITT